MGTIKISKIDINQAPLIENIIKTCQTILNNRANYFDLYFKAPYYLETRELQNDQPGWYIILDGKKPIYVGTAEHLNKRLNTNHGSTDNFANKSRKMDDKKNIIKKLIELKIFKNLKVAIISESCFLQEIGIITRENGLDNIDRKNIEKLLDICRSSFAYEN